MTRRSRRELEHLLDSIDSVAPGSLDLSRGWTVAYADDETPDREPSIAGDGYEIYATDVDEVDG